MVQSGSHSGGYQLSISDLEQWLWDAACAIRGATDAPKFSDVFDDEFAALIEQYRGEEVAEPWWRRIMWTRSRLTARPSSASTFLLNTVGAKFRAYFGPNVSNHER